ncbi:cupin domain-containing protein [Verminephrobacter aporrectodeae subsp. tuberculatae]|uniref:cupin domain-containing protein n=1 Tax=Verminephrobacter aporrectodeae TaxID=1110389 RepID=UPI002243D0F9|nr:cupin domain-containing protein [Verminephrobacter aporrectodeae]MCW8209269.1 cupin domain-containing protein [Verminephrobacter aporrectodeae subsp. tuberculatae]
MHDKTTDSHLPQAESDVRHTYLPAGTGSKIWMSGDEYQILLDAKSSGNTMTLLDALVPPAGGPPLHAHADVDELFLVLDGELDIMVDNAVYQVKAGGRVFVKRNVPHAFINRTDRPVRMLIFYTPAGVEEFFLAAGRPAINGVAPPVASAERTVREIEMGLHFHVSKAAQPN